MGPTSIGGDSELNRRRKEQARSLILPLIATNRGASGRRQAAPQGTQPSSPGGAARRWQNTDLAQQWLARTTDDYRQAARTSQSASLLQPESSLWDRIGQLEMSELFNPMVVTTLSEPATEVGHAQLASYYQEAIPTPPPSPPGDESGDSWVEGLDSNEEAKDGEGGAIAEAETLGREPEDNSLQFLRAATVLLEPGDMQFDCGLTYLYSENDFPILVSTVDGTGVDEAHFRNS